MQAIFRMGIPVSGKNIFPSNIQGLPTWYEVRVSRDGHMARTPRQVEIPCDDVILAIGQDNAFPWIERDIGIEFNEWEMPIVDRKTFQTTRDGVFVGGDAARGAPGAQRMQPLRSSPPFLTRPCA